MLGRPCLVDSSCKVVYRDLLAVGIAIAYCRVVINISTVRGVTCHIRVSNINKLSSQCLLFGFGYASQ